MYKLTIAAALAVAAFGHAAQAGEVSGGAFSFGGSSFLDSGYDSAMGYVGVNVEIGFTPNFALQTDFTSADLAGPASLGFGLHSIYHVDEAASLGFYGAIDRFNKIDGNSLGLEAGYEIAGFEGEAYAGMMDYNSESGSQFGLKAMFSATDNFSFGFSHDQISLDSSDMQSSAVRADYAIENFIVEGSIGNSQLNSGSSEPVVGLGARITFGAERGATFDRRGFGGVLPSL